MDIHELLSKLQGVKGTGPQWSAKCPAHDDRNASLSISQGSDGRILLNCHAGCDVNKIAMAMGITVDSLFPRNAKESRSTSKQLVSTYRYLDESGKVVAEKLRYEPKAFTWRRPDGAGGWVYDRRGVEVPLYGRFPGHESSSEIWLVEGEKDVDTLTQLGLWAVCSPDGAGSSKSAKWRNSYTESLCGFRVVIIPDNDDVGRKFADVEAQSLQGVAASVRVLDIAAGLWPEIPEHGDITDYINHVGHDPDSIKCLEAVAAELPEYAPAALTFPAEYRRATPAAEFGEDTTSFLWYPYLPIGDYSVLMAEGGTGKTFLCCAIAANVSNGNPLPGEVFKAEPRNVLIVSAEDSGEVLKKRLQQSGADLSRVYIIDRSASIGMNYSEGYRELGATFAEYKPALVIMDPWHAFLGADVDINRVNAIRPVFQQLAELAKVHQCALILVSHVNKRSQGENANNAATGSSDFINAARSAMRVIFDDADSDCRILVHTKSNHASAGQSVRYKIVDGGVEWAGYSNVTRQTLEEAARKRKSVGEVEKETIALNDKRLELIEILCMAASTQWKSYTYDEFKEIHGSNIFGAPQAKRVLDGLASELNSRNIMLKAGIQVSHGSARGKGFKFRLVQETAEDSEGLLL